MARRKIANTSIEKFDSEIDYVLERSENYVGSCEETSTSFISFSEDDIKVWYDVKYIPALYKIFNEVVDNSIDESIRTNFKKANKIKVEYDGNKFVVEDNGRGVPQGFDEESGQYVTEIVFADLRVGSNFNDDSGQTLIGRNGVGASLTNIFSKKFMVHTWNGKSEYKQTFKNNAREIGKPQIKPSSNKSGTKITFIPDWKYFNPTEECKKKFGDLVFKRVKDLALCLPKIKFVFNGKDVSVKKIKKYFDNDAAVFGENDHCRIGLTESIYVDSFSSIGYVNCAVTNFGTHMDYAMGKVTDYIRNYIKRKYKTDVKPAEIKNKYFLFMSIWIANPTFGSQTKEGLTSPPAKVSKIIDSIMTEGFLKRLIKNNSLIESIIEIYQLKAEKKEQAKIKKAQRKNKKIPKLIPAQSSDTKNNILMICEGDSALTELVNVRNPHIAGIPIRGKLLNIYDRKELEIIKNVELQNLMQAIGLTIGKPAKKLNYGKIGFLTDMDHDGNAIAGLLINFFYKYWPELFHEEKMVRVLSPLYTATDSKGNMIRFYSKKEFTEYTEPISKVKYHKGLGSLGPDEYELVLNQLEYILLTVDDKTDSMLKLLYSNDTDARKEWLSEVR